MVVVVLDAFREWIFLVLDGCWMEDILVNRGGFGCAWLSRSFGIKEVGSRV